jgi:hypothetical protein
MRLTLVASLCLILGTTACPEMRGDDPSGFAVGVPRQDTVMMKVPGATAGAVTLESGTQAVLGELSEWYVTTRAVSGVVNAGAIAVGTLVKLVILHSPTTVTQDQAIWGPYQGPLDPIEWKVTVTRIADHQYHYVFEGRAKNDPAAAFVTVLAGTHRPAVDALGEELEGFGAGSFTLDWNARATLPQPNPDEVGTANYDYSHLGVGEVVQINAKFRGVKDKDQPGKLVDADYVFEQQPRAEGNMTFTYKVPTTDASAGATARVHSRWLWSGAGRTDASTVATNLPVTYTVSECWDVNYLSVYKDVPLAPAQSYGDEAACAFPTAEFPTP